MALKLANLEERIENTINRDLTYSKNGLNTSHIIEILLHNGIVIPDGTNRVSLIKLLKDFREPPVAARRTRSLVAGPRISEPKDVMELSPDVSALGYDQYAWNTPQSDPNEAGYFTFTGPGVGSVDVRVNSTMLEPAKISNIESFDKAENEGFTTFEIPDIPRATAFRWSFKEKAWIYACEYGARIVYKAIALNIPKFLDHMRLVKENRPEDTLYGLRLVEQSHTEALLSVMQLKKLLGKHKLNVVTAESLTAGMLVKMLIDIPTGGVNVYGGFAVYDTDAKRKFLGVKTTGVYSHRTAYQMAAGALKNSRALVSIAVTGNAMTSEKDTEHMGHVYIGIGLRYPNGSLPYTIVTYKSDFCKLVPKLCKDWAELHQQLLADGNYRYAPLQLTSMLADFIRLQTVKTASDYASAFIKSAAHEGVLDNMRLELESWDKKCKPSWIISEHLQGMTLDECSPYSDVDIEM